MLKRKNDEVANHKTGEIQPEEVIKKNIEDKAFKATDEANNELAEWGLPPNIKTEITIFRGRNYSTTLIQEEDDEFSKVFRKNLGEFIIDQKLSRNELAFIGAFSAFITFPTNAIRINRKNPSDKELQDLMNLRETTLKNTLKKLKFHEVIKVVHKDGERFIYFNPFLICGGSIVEVNTYHLFENSFYNPKKV